MHPTLTVVTAVFTGPDTLARAAQLPQTHEKVTALSIPHGGRHSALDAALLHVHTPLVLTVDADTLLEPDALRRIVARLVGTSGCVAVAASLLVSNDDETLIARMQGWEYRLGIAAIKRQQAMFGAAFVNWALIEPGGQVEFEPTAFARTQAPTTTRALYRQRRRWARGMIEGLRTSGGTMTSSGGWSPTT